MTSKNKNQSWKRSFVATPLWAKCEDETPLVKICDFATNEFATSCEYLTFTTTIGYIYNYCLHLKRLQLLYD